MGRLRHDYLDQVDKKAPSATGQPKQFATMQANAKKAIHCNRPPGATDTIPVVLLHPVFGQFLDDIESREPTTAEVNHMALDLSNAMAMFYGDENDRATKIRKCLHDAGITLVQTVIEGEGYKTDGDMQCNRHRYVIAELKNEVGSTGAEPNAQVAAYYLESTRKLAPQCAKSPLPCFLLFIFGKVANSPAFAHYPCPSFQVHILVLAALCGILGLTCRSFLPFCLVISTTPIPSCGLQSHAI